MNGWTGPKEVDQGSDDDSDIATIVRVAAASGHKRAISISSNDESDEEVVQGKGKCFH